MSEANKNNQFRSTDPWRKVVLEHALDAVVGMDENNIIIDWNAQSEKTFGWKKEEVIGSKLVNLIIPADFKAAHQKGLEHFLKTGIGPILNRRIEVEAMNRAGERFPVELTVIPINIEGSFIFYSFIRDLTKVKQVEKAEKQMQVQMELLSKVSTVLLADPLGFETRVNKFVHMLVPAIADWAIVDIIKDDEVKLLAVAHSDPAQVEKIKSMRVKFPPGKDSQVGVFNVIHSGNSELVASIDHDLLRQASVNEEHFQLMKDLKLESYICVPLSAHGQILGSLTLVKDATHHFEKQHLNLAQELANRAAFAIHNAQLYDKAKEAIQARDEFLSIASHELKTPITSMKLNTQIFEKKLAQHPELYEEGKPVFRLLDVYNRNVDRMAKLIEDMLDITRISTGKLKLEMTSENLSELILETIERLSEELKVSGLKVETNLASTTSLPIDRFRMEQVLSNLITNAIKYAPGKKLVIGLKQQGPDLLISVADQGAGIASQNLDRIFSRFERAISANISGLGLGLYISRQIVEAHGGKIWAESVVGEGTTFFVQLPINAP